MCNNEQWYSRSVTTERLNETKHYLSKAKIQEKKKIEEKDLVWQKVDNHTYKLIPRIKKQSKA